MGSWVRSPARVRWGDQYGSDAGERSGGGHDFTPALEGQLPRSVARGGHGRSTVVRCGIHSPTITSLRWSLKLPAVIRYMNTPECSELPLASRRSHSIW